MRRLVSLVRSNGSMISPTSRTSVLFPITAIKYSGLSPTFYGAQTYDAKMLINSAVVATKGNLSDKEAVRKAMEKADFKSVRGKFRFGNNHIPIQQLLLAGSGEKW